MKWYFLEETNTLRTEKREKIEERTHFSKTIAISVKYSEEIKHLNVANIHAGYLLLCPLNIKTL